MCSNMFAGFLLPVKPQEVPKFTREPKTRAYVVSFHLTASLKGGTRTWGRITGRESALDENDRTVESAMFYSVD